MLKVNILTFNIVNSLRFLSKKASIKRPKKCYVGLSLKKLEHKEVQRYWPSDIIEYFC